MAFLKRFFEPLDAAEMILRPGNELTDGLKNESDPVFIPVELFKNT